jgi:hypothetical protein
VRPCLVYQSGPCPRSRFLHISPVLHRHRAGSVKAAEYAAEGDEKFQKDKAERLAELNRGSESPRDKEAEASKLAKKKASAEEVEIRRQAHDQWRHEPLGPTKFGFFVRSERAARLEAEQAAARLDSAAQKPKRKPKDAYKPPPEVRQRGAPKQKPKLPDAPPNPFGTSALAQARALRGTIIPAPSLMEEEERAKTGRTERAHKAQADQGDVSKEVDDLIADLESSDLMKEVYTGRGHDDGCEEYKSDVYKRRSQKVLAEAANLDWLAAELEVFDKELHSETMGSIRNTQKKTRSTKHQRERDEKTRLAMSKLPDDLLPY